MSAIKHAPGPWFVQPGFLAVYNMSGGDSGLTCTVAKVLRDQTGLAVAESNARLIAAAPELLVALTILLSRCDSELADSADVHECQAARAAIARATGTLPPEQMAQGNETADRA